MAQRYELNSDLAATHLSREIHRVRRSIPVGSAGVFMRVTLGLVFMYPIAISHSMLGISGPMLVSILFLLALLAPVMYHAGKTIIHQRRVRARQAGGIKEAEVRQES